MQRFEVDEEVRRIFHSDSRPKAAFVFLFVLIAMGGPIILGQVKSMCVRVGGVILLGDGKQRGII